MTKPVLISLFAILFTLTAASAQQAVKKQQNASDALRAPQEFTPHARGQIPMTWFDKAQEERNLNTW
jgi:hypothetical protein